MIWRNMMMAANHGGGGAISFVGATDAEVPGGSGGPSVPLPVGIQAGDFIAVFGAKDSAGGDITINTSGYTLKVKYGTASPDSYFYYKVAGASETLTISNSGSTDASIAVSVYRGVDQVTPFDVADPTVVNGNSSNPDSPPITTVTNGAWVLSVAAMDDDGVSGVTVPSGYSNLSWRSTASGGTSNNATIAVSSKELATAGAEDPSSWTFTGGSDAWVAGTHALRPA